MCQVVLQSVDSRVKIRHFFSTQRGHENHGVDQSHRMWPLYEEECLGLGEGVTCRGRSEGPWMHLFWGLGMGDSPGHSSAMN